MVTGQVEVCIQEVVMVRVNRSNFTKNIRGKIINSQTSSVRNYTTSAYAKSLTTEEYTKCSKYLKCYIKLYTYNFYDWFSVLKIIYWNISEGSENLILQLQNRAETCGDFSSDDVGRKVTLIGWIQGQHLPRFIKLKDGHGIIQCLIPTVVCVFYYSKYTSILNINTYVLFICFVLQKPELQSVLQTITSENILQVVGTVMARPESQINMVIIVYIDLYHHAWLNTYIIFCISF